MPYHECPSFVKCSCNVCPLDPLAHQKERLPGEEGCKAEKPTRMRIGEKYPDLLKETGLTHREFQARERQNALTPEQRELQLQACIKARKSIPARAKSSISSKEST